MQIIYISGKSVANYNILYIDEEVNYGGKTRKK